LRQIRTNNPVERILREIGRRTCVVGSFRRRAVGPQSCRGQLRHIGATARSTKRCVNIELLKDQQMDVPSPPKPVLGAAQLRKMCERF